MALFRRGPDVSGFRVARRLFQIQFPEDSELHGLEITVRTATLGERREYVEKFPNDGTSFDKVEYEVGHFLKYVTHWNLEDENGTPLPVTYQAFEENIPDDWYRPILNAYVSRMFGQQVSDDTEKKLETGADSETIRRMEESLPMDVSQ